MSDEFLYRFRELPRPEFAEALRVRIFREPPRLLTARRVRTGLVVFLAALIIAACAAPQTRTPIVQATKAMVRVYLMPRVILPYSVYTAGGPPRIEIVLPSGERKLVTVETMSPDEAQQRVPFQIRLPTWVPEGLEMNPLTVIPPEVYEDWVILAGWRGPYGGGMLFPDMERVPLILRIEGPNVRKVEEQFSEYLLAEKLVLSSDKANVVVEIVTPPPPETRKEINGKPVDFVECLGPPHVATLHWIREDDGVAYTLTANLEVVSQEDLFRVAETIR